MRTILKVVSSVSTSIVVLMLVSAFLMGSNTAFGQDPIDPGSIFACNTCAPAATCCAANISDCVNTGVCNTLCNGCSCITAGTDCANK